MSAAPLVDVDQRAPIGVDGFFQPRRAAFWLYVMFLANGVFLIASTLHTDYQVVPTAVVFGTFLWALYAVPFLLFFRALDLFEQHPPLGFAMAFAWGGFVATYLAIPANAAISSLAAKLGSPRFAADWGPALAGPTNEETLKYLGLIVLVMIARSQFRSILSVVIMGAFVGLGFQIVEDLIYAANTAIQFPMTNQIAPVGLMFFARGIVTGIWSHALYTSIAAFGLGYFLTRTGKPLAQRLGVAAAFFALAWGCHFFWNSPWLGDLGPDGIAGLVVVSLLKGVPILLAGYLIWRAAGREEGDRLRVLADHYLDGTLITDRERAALTSLRERRHQREQIRRTRGRRAARALHRLQRAQLHLLRVCAENGAGPQAARAAQDVLSLRRDLAADAS